MGLDRGIVKEGWSFLMERESSWRLSLSAAGPSGAQTGRMSQVVTWLLHPGSRPAELEGCLDGERLGFYDLARLTRLEPARLLGLGDLGHLKPGARASAVLYDLMPDAEPVEMAQALSDCWFLVKDGVVLREKSRFTQSVPPAQVRRRSVSGEVPVFAQTDLFQNATLRFENLGVLDKRG